MRVKRLINAVKMYIRRSWSRPAAAVRVFRINIYGSVSVLVFSHLVYTNTKKGQYYDRYFNKLMESECRSRCVFCKFIVVSVALCVERNR